MQYILIFLSIILSTVFRFGWDTYTQSAIAIFASITLIRISGKKLSLPSTTLTIFVLISILTVFFSFEKAIAYRELIALVNAYIICLVIYNSDNKLKQNVLYLNVWIAFYFSIIEIFLYLNNFFKPELNNNIVYLIINRNILAGYILLCLPLSVMLWNNKKYQFLTLVLYSGILLTYSRIAIVIASIMLIYLFWDKLADKYLRYAAYLTSIIVLVIIMSKFRQFEAFDRLIWWKTSIKMGFDNILTGSGWGNFAVAYTKYKTAPSLNTLYSHNLFLQIFAETGIFGLLFFSFFVLKYLINNLSLRKPLTLSALSFILFDLFNYSFYVPGIMILLFIIMTYSENDADLKPENRNKTILIYILSFVFVIDAIIPSVSKIASLETAMKIMPMDSQLYSDYALKSFEKYEKDKNTADLDKAIKHQNIAVSKFKYYSPYWSDLSWLYLVSNNRTEAVKCAKKAVEYDKFNTRYQKALKSIYEKVY